MNTIIILNIYSVLYTILGIYCGFLINYQSTDLKEILNKNNDKQKYYSNEILGIIFVILSVINLTFTCSILEINM